MKREEFYREVYEIVKQIPKGKVTAYGTVARLLGQPQRSRMDFLHALQKQPTRFVFSGNLKSVKSLIV